MSKPKTLVRKEPNYLIHPRTIAEGFTQSELTDMSCMYRWNLRYNQLLQKPGIIYFPFKIGDVFHDGMEQFYSTGGKRVNVATLQFAEGDIPTVHDQEDLIYWNHVLPKMLEAYQIYYAQDIIKWKIFSFERQVEVIYRGLLLLGKIDLTLMNKNGNWIADHKTSGRLNKYVVAGWDFRFQFMFYIWLMSKLPSPIKLKGYIVNLVKKPEIRVKKNETIEGFADRVKQNMIEEPEKYYYREEYIISKGALQHFQDEVLDPRIDMILFIKDNPDHPMAKSLMNLKNTAECQKYGGNPCEFIEICRHGDHMKSLFRTKPQKHLELEMSEEE